MCFLAQLCVFHSDFPKVNNIIYRVHKSPCYKNVKGKFIYFRETQLQALANFSICSVHKYYLLFFPVWWYISVLWFIRSTGCAGCKWHAQQEVLWRLQRVLLVNPGGVHFSFPGSNEDMSCPGVKQKLHTRREYLLAVQTER